MSNTFNIGDTVTVTLPGGEFTGKIRQIMENFGFVGNRETKYRVSGDDFETITSKRCLR